MADDVVPRARMGRTTCCRPSRSGGSTRSRRSPSAPAGSGTGSWSRRSSSTSRCSSGSARPPTSCARRCTSSTTRAAATSRCGPRAPRRSCARTSQHRPTVPWKVWYLAPHFRYERPQKGRYRQHWQLGAEVLGVDDPDVDVEVIALARRVLPRARAHARASAGQLDGRRRRSRPAYVDALRDVPPRPRRAGLGPEFLERVEQNPLRVLDAKDEEWQDVIERAPQLTEYLGDDAARALRACAARARRARHRARARAPPRARLRLLHAHHVRVRERRARRGAERGRRRRSLRPARRGHGRAAHARASGSASASSACSSRCRGRGEQRGDVGSAAAARSTRSSSTAWATARRPCSSRSCARPASGPTAAYGGRSVKAQWKLADRSGARFGVMLGRRRGGARRRRGQGPARPASSASCHARSSPAGCRPDEDGRSEASR